MIQSNDYNKIAKNDKSQYYYIKSCNYTFLSHNYDTKVIIMTEKLKFRQS